MKLSPRVNRARMWCSTALSCALAVAWISTLWVEMHWQEGGGARAGLSTGRVYFIQLTDATVNTHHGFHLLYPKSFEFRVWSSFMQGPPGWGVAIPLWWFVIGFGIDALLRWRLERTRLRIALLGSCLSCGYARIGLAHDQPCPECGTVPTPRPITGKSR